MTSIKHPNVPREEYDKLALELRQMKAKKEAAERLFWMLNRNRNKDISFWKQGFIATAIGMVVFFINSVLFC
jgi:hypothetical protein